MTFEFLLTRREGTVEYLTLNRPDVRNAFNDQVIEELTAWAVTINADDEVRCVVIAGAGKTFCAGADIAWMSKALGYTHDENVRDANGQAANPAVLGASRIRRRGADRRGHRGASRIGRRPGRPAGIPRKTEGEVEHQPMRRKSTTKTSNVAIVVFFVVKRGPCS